MCAIHYHNHSDEISLWVEQEIRKVLADYEIVYLDVNAELFTRLGKTKIVNSVTAKYNDKKTGKHYVLDNYTSDCTEYENKSTKWLVNAIKDIECRTFLKYGKTQNLTNNAQESVTDNKHVKDAFIKCVSVKDVTSSNKKSVEMVLFINTSQEQIKQAFINKQYLSMWTMNGFKKEKNDKKIDGKKGTVVVQGVLNFDNVEIKDIEIDTAIQLKFKLKHWKEYTDTTITFTNSGSDTKLSIKMEDVPIVEEEGIKNIWRGRIFGMICKLFNCSIKNA